MNRNTKFWQVEGNTVFKLRETGAMRRVDGQLVPEVTNDYSFLVQGPNGQDKNEEMAQKIATALNLHMNDEVPFTIEFPEPIPPNSNPFHHDLYNMGCDVSGPWLAMYDQHAGLKPDHNLSEEEQARKANGEVIWNKDPAYIKMVNQRTGFIFKINFKGAGNDISEAMQRILREREEQLAQQGQ